MFMLNLTALFRSFCFFLGHFKTASLALAAARQSAQPAYRFIFNHSTKNRPATAPPDARIG
jgi:hypothetical protein